MPELADRKKCTGCTACQSACSSDCIEMKADSHGFTFPVINRNKCIECRKCEKACPVLNLEGLPDQNTIAFAAYSLNCELREKSSSGGIWGELAKEILNRHGHVYGAAYDRDYSVKHICVTNVSDLHKLQGAKYSQSELAGIFKEIKVKLEMGILILFSGTPCQTAGLKMYLNKEYDHLICVDFVCHGVPSPMAWKQYVLYRAREDNHGELPLSVNMRSKETGWSRYQYSNVYLYGNNSMYSKKSTEDLFMKLFTGDFINRESCAACQFKGYDRVSDITLGDFWGVWDIAPEMDDNEGTSLVLIHSDKGVDIYESLSDRIKCRRITLEQASRQNPSLIQSSDSKKERKKVLDEISSGNMKDINRLLDSTDGRLRISMIQRNISACVRRAVHRISHSRNEKR